MHELSVCNALMAQLERIAADHQCDSVTRIVLKIGPLSGVETHLLRRAWPLAATGTVADNAELVTEAADIVVCCTACGEQTAARANRLLCGACGDFRTRVISGDEMILQRVELGQATTASAS